MCIGCTLLKTFTITEESNHLFPYDCSGAFEFCSSLQVINANFYMSGNIGYAFEGCTVLSKINLRPDNEQNTIIDATHLVQTFNNARAVTDIIGILKMPNPNDNFEYWKDYSYLTFNNCANLVNVKIQNCQTDLNMSTCSKLSVDSVNYLLQNATTPVTDIFSTPTIKFHANIQSYIDDGSILQDTINAVKVLGFTIIVGENTL